MRVALPTPSGNHYQFEGFCKAICVSDIWGVFPHSESLLKLYYLALERIAKRWTMPIPNWSEALNQFALEFGERMPKLD
ncbi:MAG: hypothetical protein WCK27_13580 [Verrucomicrobiota bacterium]